MSLSSKIVVGSIGALFAFSACSNGSGSSTQSGVAVPTGANPVGQIALSVYNPSGALIYSSANSSTTLQMTSGVAYNLQVSGAQIPSGTVFSMQATNIDVVNEAPQTTSLTLGNNSYTPPTPGDYLLQISATVPGASLVDTQTFQASVICANPNFTASSLNPAGISVTAGSGNNLYNFSAAAVTSGANGMAPYLCAWDVDGDSIQDTPFTDCGTALSNEYVNYVGTRTIGLIVKDSCNVSQTVSASQNLAYTVPAMPGNVFIYGQTSAETGTAATDARINGINYLATNSGGYNYVQPLYTPGASGQGSFTIVSSMTYGQLSSVNFGMELDVGNISDTINVSTMTGTIDAAAATLNKTIYSTDESGDQAPARNLLGTTCVLTNPGATVIFQAGTPCSAGTTGDQNSANVEVWGNYVCAVSDSAGATTITGSFDGIAHLADNCVGGGGGGGGGINPIGL